MRQFLDKKQKKKQENLLRNSLVFVVLSILALVGIFKVLGFSMHFLGKPVWKVENILLEKTKKMGAFFSSKSYLFNENKRIQDENQSLKLAMIDYNILKNENVQLKENFGRISPVNTFVLGAILVKPDRSPYDTLIIDIGQNLNLTEGAKVYGNSTVPIGFISHLYPFTSQVVLYSNPNTQTDVMVEGLDTTLILTGRGGGNFEMSAPHDFDASIGSNVFLPGLQSEPIAVITSVLSKPTDPNKKYLLRTLVNIQNMKWVEVKKN